MNSRVSFSLEPIVHLYKQRKSFSNLQEENVAVNGHGQTAQASAAAAAVATTLYPGPSLKISVPCPGVYSPSVESPPPEVSPKTIQRLEQEALETMPIEQQTRDHEATIRKVALEYAFEEFVRSKTPIEHTTPHSDRTPASCGLSGDLSPSPLALSPMVASPRANH